MVCFAYQFYGLAFGIVEVGIPGPLLLLWVYLASVGASSDVFAGRAGHVVSVVRAAASLVAAAGLWLEPCVVP